MKKIKTLRGIPSLMRFQATLRSKPNGELYTAGFMPCYKMPVISAYCYSPAYCWNRLDNKTQDCVKAIETSHAVYEVWQLESKEEYDSLVPEIDAEKEHIEHLKNFKGVAQ